MQIAASWARAYKAVYPPGGRCEAGVAPEALRSRPTEAKRSVNRASAADSAMEQVGLSLEAASGVSADEVGMTDGHAESNESAPSRGQVAAPNVRAEGGYAGWCVPTCCIVDSCFAQVRFDAGTSLDLAPDNARLSRGKGHATMRWRRPASRAVPARRDPALEGHPARLLRRVVSYHNSGSHTLRRRKSGPTTAAVSTSSSTGRRPLGGFVLRCDTRVPPHSRRPPSAWG